MKSINHVHLVGFVGQDPKINPMKDGTRCATFQLATSDTWKDKNTGEQKSLTEWHTIVIFNSVLVTVVEKYIKKGSYIYVEGELKTRKWTNKDGVEMPKTEIVLKNYKGELIVFDRPNSPTTLYKTETAPSYSMDLDDEVPF